MQPTPVWRKRAITERKNAPAQHAWKPSDQPDCLTEMFFAEKIQPLIASTPARYRETNLGIGHGLSPRTFVGAEVARIRSTGRRWRNWSDGYDLLQLWQVPRAR